MAAHPKFLAKRPRPVGQLEVIIGCMFAGKTDTLIDRLQRGYHGRLWAKAYKHSLDNRYDTQKLTTHAGRTYDAVAVDSVEAMDTHWARQPPPYMVGIDEAQFFDDSLPDFCLKLVAKKTIVVVAGLNIDSDGKPFGPMGHLLAIADKITKTYAVCIYCGADATHSLYVGGKKDKQVVVGGKVYQARCRACWEWEWKIRTSKEYMDAIAEEERAK